MRVSHNNIIIEERIMSVDETKNNVLYKIKSNEWDMLNKIIQLYTIEWGNTWIKSNSNLQNSALV